MIEQQHINLNRELMVQHLSGYCDFIIRNGEKFISSFMPDCVSTELLSVYMSSKYVYAVMYDMDLRNGVQFSVTFDIDEVLDWVDYQR